ncbi:hypothetical protein D3C71_2060540 [compost metagenome]
MDLERIFSLPDADKNILNNILGSIFIFYPAKNMDIEFFPVLFVQKVISNLIAQF